MTEAGLGQVMNVSAGGSQTKKPQEATDAHTRILRLALGVEESRAYWEHVDPQVPVPARAADAFEGRWFGGKSLERAKFLISAFAERYDNFPAALTVLRRWHTIDLPTRIVVCHWHVQLSDPIYRRFTGEMLVERRAHRDARVDRNAVLRWVKAEYPERWSEATCVQFASKLLSAASEAGILSPKRDPRALLFPKVPDLALTYLFYLLRGVKFQGMLTENPYLASVGLDGATLDQRLRNLPGLSFRRMTDLVEFEWASPDLVRWAEATL